MSEARLHYKNVNSKNYIKSVILLLLNLLIKHDIHVPKLFAIDNNLRSLLKIEYLTFVFIIFIVPCIDFQFPNPETKQRQ